MVFALLAGVIFATVGISVDTSGPDPTSPTLVRAANAAALAGASRLPDLAASTAAADAAARAVVPQANAAGHTLAVHASRLPAGCDDAGIPCSRGQLEVTVSVSLPTTFLHILGIGTHTLSETARAQSFRPLTLGQPGATLGYTESQIQPAMLPGANYILSQMGFNDSRHKGDAYTSDPNNVNDANVLNGPTPFANYSSGAFKSNDVHQISAQMKTENPDPTLPSRGGQNFLVYVPPGTTAEVDVYNASNSPDEGYADNHLSNQPTAPCYNALGEGLLFHATPFQDPTKPDYYKCWDQTATVAGGSTTWKYQPSYSQERYTLFGVASPGDRLLDTKLTQLTVDPMNGLNTWNGQLVNMRTSAAITGCDYTTWSDCPIVHSWINVGAYGGGNDRTSTSVQRTGSPVPSISGGAAGAYYRLRVDRLTYDGQVTPVLGQGDGLKVYSLRVVTAGTSTPCSGCTVSGIGDMTVYTPISNATFTVPLVSIPPEYAGQNVSVDLWDIGDVVNATSVKVALLDPFGQAAPVARVGAQWDVVNNGSSRDGSGPGIMGQGFVPSKYLINPGFAAVQTLDLSLVNDPFVFNGRWLHFTIAVPASYNPGPNTANWFWKLQYQTDGNAFDQFGVAVSWNGSPAHLLP